MKCHANGIVASVVLVCGLALLAPLSAQSRSPGLESVWAAAGFGAAIAIGDGEIFVGRTGGGLAGAIYPSPGTIHVFERGDDRWDFAYIITGDDVEIGDEFGAALAADGDRLLVGSPGRADGAGGAYFFERGNDGAWAQTTAFVPPADRDIRGAGSSVALSGDAVYLGAPSEVGPGAVLRFDAAGGSATILASPVLSTIDRFGASLSLTGDLLFVGAPGTRGDRGAAYAFNAGFPATGPSPTAILALPEGRGGDAFGTSLAASGTSVLIGAPGADEGAGAALLFTRGDDGEWTAAARLSFPEAGPAGYGSAVAFDGRSAWVGASGVGQGAGGAQVFQVIDAPSPDAPTATITLDPQSTIPAPGFSRGALFGSFVALRDDVAVVAASNADMRLGAAVVFERRDGGWVESSILRESTRTLTAVTGEETPCTDGATGPFDCSQVDLVAFVPLASLGADPGTILNDIWGWTDPVTGRRLGAGRALGRHGLRRHQRSRQSAVRRRAAADRGGHREPLAGHQGVRGPCVHRRRRRRNARRADLRPHAAQGHLGPAGDLHRDRTLRRHRQRPQHCHQRGERDGVRGRQQHGRPDLRRRPAHDRRAHARGARLPGLLRRRHHRTPSAPATPTDAQCVIYRGPDEDYQGREICFGANETALSIADVTDRDNPVAIARGEYPNVAYAHQGWLTEDHRHFFMGDEADEPRAASTAPAPSSGTWPTWTTPCCSRSTSPRPEPSTTTSTCVATVSTRRI